MSGILEEMRKSTTGALDKARLALNRGPGGSENEGSASSNSESGGDPQQVAEDENSSTWSEELSQYCPKLTFQQRLIGFATSFGMGYLIAFFSFKFFIRLVEGNPMPFVVNYTFGHILQLMASMFLCGPKRQFRNMFDDTRYMTSVVYLTCLVATIVLVFLPMPSGPKLFFLLMLTLSQFGASTWYSLSYIPYGRRTALRFMKRWLGIEESSSPSYSGLGTMMGISMEQYSPPGG